MSSCGDGPLVLDIDIGIDLREAKETGYIVTTEFVCLAESPHGE